VAPSEPPEAVAETEADTDTVAEAIAATLPRADAAGTAEAAPAGEPATVSPQDAPQGTASPSSDPALAGVQPDAPHPGAGEIGRDIAALVKQMRRGSASPGERLAAEHLIRELRKAGLSVTAQDFRAPSSDALEHVALSALLALSGLLVELVPAAALACSLLCTALYAMFLVGVPSPLEKLLRKGASRNVVGVVPATRGKRRRLVVSANYDSAQRLLRGRVPGGFVLDRTVTLITALGAAALAALRLVSGPESLLTLIGFGIGAYGLIRMLLMVRGLRSHVVPGANDNASGVAAALHLARRFAADPPADHEIVILLTGSKESGRHGMRHYVRSDAATNEARYVVLEGLGAGKLQLVTSEGLLLRTRYPKPLPDVARRLLKFRQHRFVPETWLSRGFLDARAVARANRSVIALVGLDGRGRIPLRYRAADTPDKVQVHVACQAADFVVDLVRELESRAE